MEVKKKGDPRMDVHNTRPALSNSCTCNHITKPKRFPPGGLLLDEARTGLSNGNEVFVCLGKEAEYLQICRLKAERFALWLPHRRQPEDYDWSCTEGLIVTILGEAPRTKVERLALAVLDSGAAAAYRVEGDSLRKFPKGVRHAA